MAYKNVAETLTLYFLENQQSIYIPSAVCDSGSCRIDLDPIELRVNNDITHDIIINKMSAPPQYTTSQAGVHLHRSNVVIR